MATTAILLLLLIGYMASSVSGACNEPSANDLYNEAHNVIGLPPGSWQGVQRYNNCLAYDAQRAFRSLAATIVLHNVNTPMQFPVRVQAACVGSTVKFNVTANQRDLILRNETSYCGECLPFPTNSSDSFVAPCVPCHDDCAGPCSGLTALDCLACRNDTNDDVCVKCGANERPALNGTCVCAGAWAGPQCTTCTLSCFNGAVPQSDCNSCACAFGYTGRLCETKVDECASQPCHNDGTCVAGYACICFVGFTGLHCETNVNECASTPCANGGTCMDLTDDFACSCVTGYTGMLCETELPSMRPCESNPCLNNGTCTASGACTCPNQFTGTSCETNLLSCEANAFRCKNGFACSPDCVVCRAVEESTPYGNFSWPDVSLGQVHALPCPDNNANPAAGVATRTCEDSIVGFPRWSDTNIEGCRNINDTSKSLELLAKVQISNQTVLFVLQATSGATRNKENLVETDVVNVGIILSNVSVLETFQQNVVENVVEIVSNVLETSNDVLFNAQLSDQSSVRIYRSVEHIATRAVLPKNVSYVSLTGRNFAIDFYDPSTTSDGGFSGYSFGLKRPLPSIPLSPTDELNDDQLFRQSGPLNSDTSFEAAIYLPNDVFQAPNANGGVTTERLTFFYYQNSKLFQPTEISPTERNAGDGNGGGGDAPDLRRIQSNRTVATRVIGAIVGTTEKLNLSSPIEITFAALNLTMSYANDSCSSWSAKRDNDYGEWTDYGCTLISSNGKEFTCSCTHLTNFAVLVDPYEGKGISKESAFALSIISYIGCSLSLLGLTVTVITYLSIKKLRKERPGKILINLCIAMIFGLAFFVAYAVNRGNGAMCTATAFLLHYFWLASICWMGVEGVNMYMSLVRVLGTYVHRFVLKAGLVAWGLPLLVIAASAAGDYDNGYKKTDESVICRLSVPLFYGSFYGILAIILIFDIVIFALVMRTITKRSKTLGIAKRKKQNNARRAIAVSILLGCNWIFAVTASDDETGATVRLVFDYLFAITASFQGFLIFVFHCFLRDEVRQAWKTMLCFRRSVLGSSTDTGKALNLSHTPASHSNLGTTSISSPVESAGSNFAVANPVAIEMAEMKESVKEDGALGDSDQAA